MSQHQCQSCAMPIETGIYCQYCVDANGNLPPFEERFDRMVHWMQGQKPGLSPEEARQQTLAYMSQMPAWRDNPALKAALAKR